MAEIIKKLGLKEVINASGKMTILGVSKISNEVAGAQKKAGQNFFVMDELAKRSGAYLADILHTEDAQIVSCASAGIVQSIAAFIGRGSQKNLHQPYCREITLKREVIIPKGHNVDYGGTPIELLITQGGGISVEAGYANVCTPLDISRQVTLETVAILYIKSHHTVQKSMLTVYEAIEVAKAHSIPLIIDAASEEDLFCYTKAGADLVIYSGSKAIEGPSSGLVIGKKKYVEWVRLQSKGIGRTMKVGKENIVGLITAIEHYLANGPQTGSSMKKRLKSFVSALNKIEGISAEIVQDAAGRDIYRASVKVDETFDVNKIIDQQQTGDPAIYTRNYQANKGIIEYDIRAVNEQEMAAIIKRLSEIMQRVVS